MITLHGFGPGFGLPDASPFVTKVEVLLKMAKLPYRTQAGNVRRAPKGKLPFIEDDGEQIADSTFIRWHLERKHGIEFDRGLSVEQRATAWAFEKMVEDQLYWFFVDVRWLDDRNFEKGPATFFKGLPAPMRFLITKMIRRKIGKAIDAQGTGRHAPAERVLLATRSFDAASDYLGDKPFFMGAEPTGVDATMFAFMAGALCPLFEGPLRDAAARHENLNRYVGRMTARLYPERSEMAGVRAAA
jgi:glutathione S-transferase